MNSRYLLSLVALLPFVFAQDTDPDLLAALLTTPTNEGRIQLLTDDQFVFDFFSDFGKSIGAGGTTTAANAGNFPALIGNGIAMTIGFLGPCGFNTPHVHPRATEINFSVNATLRTGMLAENGARFVFNDVPAGSATVFPRGAIHFEMNTGCEPALFVAGFNHEDPGTSAMAQRFFGLPPDIVAASFGDIGVEEVAGLEAKIPNNIAIGTADCLKKCGITPNATQPTSQRQPRVPGNALPAGFSGPPPPAPASTSASASAADPSSTKKSKSNSNYHANSDYHADYHADVKGAVKGAFSASDAVNSATSFVNDSNVKPFIIAMLAINGLFVIGILVALFLFIIRRRGGNNNRSRSVDKAALLGQYQPTDGKSDPEYYDPYPAKK